MKHILFVFALFVAAGFVAHAQDDSYKVVFDLTNPDAAQQNKVVRWIELITESNPKAQMEVVMYGKGFELVMTEKSTVSDKIKEALKNPNVSFRVCAMAMAKHKITLDMFFNGVQSVPDGIHELVKKQQAGWGYIKVVD